MSYLVPRVSVWIASDAVEKMRNDLIDHMMTLDLAYFERTAPGDMILRLVQQADGLSGFVGQSTVKALRDAATVIIVSGYLALAAADPVSGRSQRDPRDLPVDADRCRTRSRPCRRTPRTRSVPT